MNRINELLHKASDRKILSTMTDEEWQENFAILKTIVKPTNETKLSRHGTHVRVINRTWSLSKGNGDGTDTMDKRYCDYINDILKVIRKKRNNHDVLYHVYQVYEMLRFEPSLNCKLVHSDGMDYFEVWLL